MKDNIQFRIERKPNILLKLIRQIQIIADSEKEALGFWREPALKEAIKRKRLFAMVVDTHNNCEVAGYIHYSGIFPHAKIQQIATLTKYRKYGVATALMNTLVSDLEHLCFMTIKADVASDLGASLRFYARSSFEAMHTRAGGQTRNRTIIVHERQLDTDSLFPVTSQKSGASIDLGIRRRSAGDAPIFAFDLNIYFDLIKKRDHSDKARQLFGAALSHEIRLAVADEFANELQRTTNENSSDPILQMALRLPRLPKANESQLDTLSDEIHNLVFLHPKAHSANSPQALSDARHIAHAALARASAFITRDGMILNAQNALLSTIGIDVVTLDELVSLLPPERIEADAIPVHGNGFECIHLSGSELAHYLTEVKISDDLISEFSKDHEANMLLQREAIREGGRTIAVGAIKIPKGMEPMARLLVHVHPEHVDSSMFAEYILSTLVRSACAQLPTSIELVHLPGQSATSSLARARGFHRNGLETSYFKVALGRPLTSANWPASVREIRRRTGLTLPEEMPASGASRHEVTITTRLGHSFGVAAGKLEDILSPAIFIWPGRDGVVVPIGRAYADDLLGSSRQTAFAFVASRDAAFLSRRSYVNSPRTASLMRPESPILFYESIRSGGRGAVVAVARIVDAVVIRKNDIPNDALRRLVVDDVDEFSSSDDVLLTTFDNLFVVPKPVMLKELKKLDAIGGANLVSSTSISSEKITIILTQGWISEKLR